MRLRAFMAGVPFRVTSRRIFTTVGRMLGTSSAKSASPWRGKRLDNGTTVFQVSAQGSHGPLPFPGVQPEPGNHDCQMPAQFLLLNLAHQAQEFFLMLLEQFRMLARHFFCRVWPAFVLPPDLPPPTPQSVRGIGLDRWKTMAATWFERPIVLRSSPSDKERILARTGF